MTDMQGSADASGRSGSHERLPQISAVVFDLDGLMLNTEDVFDISGRQLLQRRGMEMTDEIHHSMLGRRPHEAFQALKDLTGLADSIEDLMEETKQIFADVAEDRLEVMPGLLSLLDLIDGIGLPKAVATSSPRDYMENMLGRFDLLCRFPVTLTAEDVTHGKPHPEIYLTAAERLEVSAENMLVLEDSETGTRAAAASGAVTISVPNRHTISGDFTMAWRRVTALHAPEIHELFGRRS